MHVLMSEPVERLQKELKQSFWQAVLAGINQGCLKEGVLLLLCP